jgi:uncharacterized protein
MKRIAVLLAFTLALCLPLTAHADEASRRAKAEEMVQLLHMDTLMKQLMDGMRQQVSTTTQQLAGKTLTPQDQARLDEFQQKLYAMIDAQIGWKAIEPDILDLYAETFTDDELDGILAFYKSPAGISMVQKLPGLTTQAMQLTQSRMATLQPQVKQMIADFARESAPRASPKAQ